MNLLSVIDPSDSRIAFFKQLRGNDPRITSANGVLVEGEKQVERLLQLKLPLLTLFMEPKFYARFKPLLSLRDLSTTECFVADREIMSEIIGYPLHNGVMALAERPKPVSLFDLKPPIVAFNSLADPENIGSIARSCVAFGVASLLVDSLSCDPLIRRAVRVSMGCLLTMDICYVSSLSRAITRLNETLESIAIENSPNALPISAGALPLQSVLVFGNERMGISGEVLSVCKRQIKIPMNADLIESLNVSATASIVLERLYSTIQQSLVT